MSQEIPSCGTTYKQRNPVPETTERAGDTGPSALRRRQQLGATAIGALSVVGGEMILRAANLAAAVVIARLLGVSALGLYASALAFATVLITLSDNGLQIQIVPEATRKRGNTSAVLAEFYVAKTCLFIVATAAALAIAGISHTHGEAWTVSALIIAKMMGYSYGQINFGVLKSNGKATAIGVIQGAHACLLLAIVYLTWRLRLSLPEMLCGTVMIQLLEVFVSFATIPGASVKAVLGRLPNPWSLIQSSAPVGIVYVLANCILRADTIILSVLASKEIVGYFAAANQGLTVVYVAAWQFGSVLLPHLVDCAGIGAAALYDEASRTIRRTWIFVAPASILLAFLCPLLIRALYGKSFARAGPMASIMLLAAPLICSNSVYFNCFLAQRKTGLVVRIYLLTAAFAAVADWTLGWVFGPQGIAFAILAREVLMFLGWKQLAGSDASLVSLPQERRSLPGIASGTPAVGQ